MIMKKNVLYILTTCFVSAALAIILIPSFVSAHYASITVDNYTPAPGDEILVNIGFGHSFPGKDEMRREAYDHTRLVIVDPMGKTRSVSIAPREKKGHDPIKLTLNESGPHTLILTQKNYASKTTKGYKYQPRNKLKNVLHAKWSETVSKALIMVGGNTKASSEQVSGKIQADDRFQITPLENSDGASSEQFLPVKVTLDGKPWQGMVYATYAGFSDKTDTFAYATRTDKQGIAEIKRLEKGTWLVKADHVYPFENKDEADEYSLKATLTFED